MGLSLDVEVPYGCVSVGHSVWATVDQRWALLDGRHGFHLFLQQCSRFPVRPKCFCRSFRTKLFFIPSLGWRQEEEKKIFVKMHSRPEPPPRPPPLQFKSFSFTEFRLINILIHFFFYFSSRVVYIVNQKLYRKPSFFFNSTGFITFKMHLFVSHQLSLHFILGKKQNKTEYLKVFSGISKMNGRV